MIQYRLRCKDGHEFDSWFQSSTAYERLAASGHVACAVCGAEGVEKALMAPAVTKTAEAPRPLAEPASEAERQLTELRRQIEENSDYVGLNFAAEARAIHDGDSPARSIYGEARPDEARALLEDGIPVAPLPFRPARRSN